MQTVNPCAIFDSSRTLTKTRRFGLIRLISCGRNEVFRLRPGAFLVSTFLAFAASNIG